MYGSRWSFSTVYFLSFRNTKKEQERKNTTQPCILVLCVVMEWRAHAFRVLFIFLRRNWSVFSRASPLRPRTNENNMVENESNFFTPLLSARVPTVILVYACIPSIC